ncbi:MAG: BON domain-containing protein [Bryobacteraceae bacterium]
MKTLPLLCILFALFSLNGFTQAAKPKPKAPAFKPVPNDAAIEKVIRAKFAKSKISANQFQVTVRGGVATIEGRTDVIQHKGVATRLAKSGGAVRVVNKIEISEAARQKAAAKLESGRKQGAAKRAQVSRSKRSEVAGR